MDTDNSMERGWDGTGLVWRGENDRKWRIYVILSTIKKIIEKKLIEIYTKMRKFY